MTDKQIIIDGKQTTKEDFIDNFSIELTNCNIEERKQIGGRYFDIILRKEKECEELKKQLIKCDDNIIVDCEYSKKDLCSFIHRKEEVINGLQQQLDQLKEQIKYQQNFIDSLLLATNNSEWLDKSILDDEASEIIEKIEMDYIELEEGKEINAELKAENEKLKQTLIEIKEFVENEMTPNCDTNIILQKINEVEDVENN